MCSILIELAHFSVSIVKKKDGNSEIRAGQEWLGLAEGNFASFTDSHSKSSLQANFKFIIISHIVYPWRLHIG
ncbi:hypothetical protein M408DRAFT_100955 [Serendipita vermifera MAFF 305830]|uniref:Uncharacterized protein n=1 Tax=Serendipita vermifera MAFF 305830 TaxID=933852 RepID=A0A0C3B022_SERVB|nr:hypothetical protein M408DRAFT_100955 [Serendipita vermifera MAFF 305830]